MATANEMVKGVITLAIRNFRPVWTPFELKQAPKGIANILVALYDTGLSPWPPFSGPTASWLELSDGQIIINK